MDDHLFLICFSNQHDDGSDDLSQSKQAVLRKGLHDQDARRQLGTGREALS